MSFNLLCETVRKAIKKKGFSETEIQRKMIPVLLEGKHALGIAATGTGKTEAALLPVLHKLLEKERENSVEALYITPLRALNRDILSRLTWWAEETGISVAVRHGDTPASGRSKQLKQPPRLLITTPESLNAMLCAPKMSKKLTGVKYVIIDEIHELAESKRGVQLALELERLSRKAGEFQRIALSATVGDPEYIAKFICPGRHCEICKAEESRQMKIDVELPQPVRQDFVDAERINTKATVVAKLRRLREIMEKHRAVLIFVNTRSTAEMLSSRLASYVSRDSVDVHHSSLSKDVRVITEKRFKQGEIKALISTSSLELGIDIGRIDVVVQYGSPRQVKRAIQRIGRSGHSIDRTSKGIILSTDIEDYVESRLIAEMAKQGRIEKTLRWGSALDVLAHEMVGLSLEESPVDIMEAFQLVKRLPVYENLDYDSFISVLKQLEKERLIWLDEKHFGKRRAARLYYYTNLSTIADEQKFFVKDVNTNKTISTLDEGFVASELERNAVFISKGQAWRVLDITEKEVLVEQKTDLSASIPAWEGEQIPVSFELARAFGKALREGKFAEENKSLAAFLKKQEKEHKIDENEISIESEKNYVILSAFFGSKVNETLGKYLATLITAYLGQSVRMKSDPYRIVFEFPDEARPELVKKFLEEKAALRSVLMQGTIRSSLFKSKFIHVAKRFGLLRKEVSYKRVGIAKIIDAVIDSPIVEETFNEIATEKFDIDRTEDVLNDIAKGRIKIRPYKGKASPFARNAFEKIMHLSELMNPQVPEAQLVNLLMKRVNNKVVKLYCTYCGKIFYRRISELPDEVKCPSCASTMVALVKKDDASILMKLRQKKALNREESKFLKALMETANIINAYGKRAVQALSARGIGPKSAKRILGNLHRDDYSFFKNILEEQRNFFKTKQYWKQAKP